LGEKLTKEQIYSTSNRLATEMEHWNTRNSNGRQSCHKGKKNTTKKQVRIAGTGFKLVQTIPHLS